MFRSLGLRLYQWILAQGHLKGRLGLVGYYSQNQSETSESEFKLALCRNDVLRGISVTEHAPSPGASKDLKLELPGRLTYRSQRPKLGVGQVSPLQQRLEVLNARPKYGLLKGPVTVATAVKLF